MADLSGSAVSACDNLAVDNDSAADSSSQRDHNKASGSLAAAFPHLSERCHISVISRFGRNAQKLGHLFSNVFPAPVQIDRARKLTGLVNRSRNAHAGAQYVFLRNIAFSQLLLHGRSYVRKNM